LPFLPKNSIPPGSKVKKTYGDFRIKEKLCDPLSEPAAGYSQWARCGKSSIFITHLVLF